MLTLPAPLEACRLVLVLRGATPERALAIADAVAEAGIADQRCALEVTADHPDHLAAITEIAAAHPRRPLGVGTVRRRDQVAAARDAGAGFAVSAHLDEAVLAELLADGVAAIPGVMTPSEAMRAQELGAAAVKWFPAGALGAAVLRCWRGPIPDLPVLATGGIRSPAAAAEQIAAGAQAVGIGVAADRAPADVAADCLTYLAAVEAS